MATHKQVLRRLVSITGDGPDGAAYAAAADLCEEAGDAKGAARYRLRAAHCEEVYGLAMAMAYVGATEPTSARWLRVGNFQVRMERQEVVIAVQIAPVVVLQRDVKRFTWTVNRQPYLDGYLTRKVLRLIDWCGENGG